MRCPVIESFSLWVGTYSRWLRKARCRHCRKKWYGNIARVFLLSSDHKFDRLIQLSENYILGNIVRGVQELLALLENLGVQQDIACQDFSACKVCSNSRQKENILELLSKPFFLASL
jgi:hypothetical protein